MKKLLTFLILLTLAASVKANESDLVETPVAAKNKYTFIKGCIDIIKDVEICTDSNDLDTGILFTVETSFGKVVVDSEKEYEGVNSEHLHIALKKSIGPRLGTAILAYIAGPLKGKIQKSTIAGSTVTMKKIERELAYRISITHDGDE